MNTAGPTPHITGAIVTRTWLVRGAHALSPGGRGCRSVLSLSKGAARRVRGRIAVHLFFQRCPENQKAPERAPRGRTSSTVPKPCQISRQEFIPNYALDIAR